MQGVTERSDLLSVFCALCGLDWTLSIWIPSGKTLSPSIESKSSTNAIVQAELNAPQAVISCEKESIRKSSLDNKLPTCIPMNTDQFAVVSSIYTLGGLIGAVAAGPASSKYGRLLTMRATTLFFVLGPVLEAAASTIAAMCFGRLLSGVGSGAAVVVVPIYISELSPPKERGLFGTLTQIMINAGILLAQVMGYFLSRGNLWRIILLSAGCVGVLQFLGLLLIPESPKWLAANRQGRRARDILRKFRGASADIEEEMREWKIDIEEDIGLSHGSCYWYIY